MRRLRKHIVTLLVMVAMLGAFILCERLGLLNVGCDTEIMQQVELFGIGAAFCTGVALFVRAVWLLITDLIFENSEPCNDSDWMGM